MWSRTDRHVLAADTEHIAATLADPGRLPEWHRAIAGAVRDGRRWSIRFAHPALARLLGAATSRPVEGGVELGWPSLRISWRVVETDGHPLVIQRATGSGVFLESAVTAVLGDFPDRVATLAALVEVPRMESPRTVITGGTGFLGRRLAAALHARGREVVLLTRSVDPALPYRQQAWTPKAPGEWEQVLRGGPVDVVNLAGRLVDVRPTPGNIASLRDSRVDATRTLVMAARGNGVEVRRWLQASTTAIWGDAGEQRIDESTPLPRDARALEQMTGVARPWEEAAQAARADRQYVLRTSITWERDSPAFDRLAGLARSGLGGTVGNGLAWISWIHLADWLRIARLALDAQDPNERLASNPLPEGALVLAAPAPVRNTELMASLRAKLAPRLGGLRPQGLGLPTPESLLRVGSVLLQTDPALALTGRHATSRVLEEIGFAFDFPRLGAAIEDVLG